MEAADGADGSDTTSSSSSTAVTFHPAPATTVNANLVVPGYVASQYNHFHFTDYIMVN